MQYSVEELKHTDKQECPSVLLHVAGVGITVFI